MAVLPFPHSHFLFQIHEFSSSPSHQKDHMPRSIASKTNLLHQPISQSANPSPKMYNDMLQPTHTQPEQKPTSPPYTYTNQQAHAAVAHGAHMMT